MVRLLWIIQMFCVLNRVFSQCLIHKVYNSPMQKLGVEDAPLAQKVWELLHLRKAVRS